jgi:hypothetical protein
MISKAKLNRLKKETEKEKMRLLHSTEPNKIDMIKSVERNIAKVELEYIFDNFNKLFITNKDLGLKFVSFESDSMYELQILNEKREVVGQIDWGLSVYTKRALFYSFTHNISVSQNFSSEENRMYSDMIKSISEAMGTHTKSVEEVFSITNVNLKFTPKYSEMHYKLGLAIIDKMP